MTRCATGCGAEIFMPFTDSNVPLCRACYGEWVREPSCRCETIWTAMGWDGNLTTASTERIAKFHAELATRTVAWAGSVSKARAA